jgi:hypothetical protein
MKTSMSDIAKELHGKARANGHSEVNLGRGLRLQLWYREEDMVLVMSRPGNTGFGSPPSIPGVTEIKVCKHAFFGDSPLKVIDHPGTIEVDGVGCVLYENEKVYLSVDREEVTNDCF